MNIGIIGHGTVGKVICKGFEDKAELHVYDPLYPPERSTRFKASVADVWRAADFTFVAVPTPQKPPPGELGGPFDSSHVDEAVATVAAAQVKEGNSNKVVIITSTTLPAKVREYLDRYPRLNLVMLPEFLTERNAQQDFLSPPLRIIGGEPEHTRMVQRLFEQYSICTPCKVSYCDAVGAAFIKYMVNSFLAVKITLLNQFYDLLRKSGSNTEWPQLSEILHSDPRMGTSHKNVPGYDGDRGFGGKCLPKDINAIMRDARAQGDALTLLEKAWEYNLSIRSKIDW